MSKPNPKLRSQILRCTHQSSCQQASRAAHGDWTGDGRTGRRPARRRRTGQRSRGVTERAAAQQWGGRAAAGGGSGAGAGSRRPARRLPAAGGGEAGRAYGPRGRPVARGYQLALSPRLSRSGAEASGSGRARWVAVAMPPFARRWASGHNTKIFLLGQTFHGLRGTKILGQF